MIRKLKPFEAFPRIHFRDPDTGFVQSASTLTELYKNVSLYRIQNKLEPIENLAMVVEDYLCSQPENANRCRGVQLERGWRSYVKGGLQLIVRMMYPQFVGQAEADKRAEQCVACDHNVLPDRDVFPSWANDQMIDHVGERKSKLNDELGQCEVCHCPLRAKVFIGGTLPKFTDKEVVELKKVNCWQLKLSGQ